MDIEPRGWSYRPEFVAATGGFFLPGDPVARSIAPFESWDFVRRNMLLLLLRSIVERDIGGDLAELGVYRGVTARLLHEYCPDRTILLFDTFAGFDERDATRDGERAGMFGDTSVERVVRYVGDPSDRVVVRRGVFPDSLTAEDRRRTFAFVHLDADLYAPTLAGLRFFHPRLSRGGMLVVHDYNSWDGARRAVDEFARETGEVVIPLPDKSGSALFVKAT